jgi:hypothetical protein
VCCSSLSGTSKIDRSEELRDFVCGLVIRCHISKKLPNSTVGDVIVKWKCEDTITTKQRPGRPRIMTNRDRRAFKKVVREAGF